MLDYGYPQNSDITLMKSLIRLGKATEEQTEDESTITSQITGAIDWRREGITYRKNEMFIDTLESVNLLISNTGAVLRSEVIGKIVMKAYLTGMPECRFGLNDKLLISNEKKAKGVRRGKGTGVEIDDCSFHRCVRLGRFDQDRTITFIPPDGEFELMKYRVTENINLPFRILPVYEEISGTTLKINIKLIANFSKQVAAQNVELKIPVPPNTANVVSKVASGTATYNSADQTIDWVLRKLTGGMEVTFAGRRGARVRRSRGEDAEDDPGQGVEQAAHQRDLRRALVHLLRSPCPLPQGLREVVLPDDQVGPLHDSLRRLPDPSVSLLRLTCLFVWF